MLPYKIARVHQLPTNGYAQRATFFQSCMDIISSDSRSLPRIAFYDGFLFHVSFSENTQDTLTWAIENSIKIEYHDLHGEDKGLVCGARQGCGGSRSHQQRSRQKSVLVWHTGHLGRVRSSASPLECCFPAFPAEWSSSSHYIHDLFSFGWYVSKYMDLKIWTSKMASKMASNITQFRSFELCVVYICKGSSNLYFFA